MDGTNILLNEISVVNPELKSKIVQDPNNSKALTVRLYQKVKWFDKDDYLVEVYDSKGCLVVSFSSLERLNNGTFMQDWDGRIYKVEKGKRFIVESSEKSNIIEE